MKWIELKMDFLGRRPESQKTIYAIHEETDNNPEVAFEKFKRSAKENLLGISGVLIGIAGVVATIAVAIRNSAKRAGNTAQKAGSDAEKNGGVGGLVGNLRKNMGKIISWTGNNILMTLGIIAAQVVLMKRR